MSYGIVVSEFNPEITEPLLKACLKGFQEQRIKVDVMKVPGAVEIPLTIQNYIRSKHPRAVVALGCVVRGETDHYDRVCHMVSHGIMELSLKAHTPIIFEVLMVDTIAKAKKRIKKGYEAAYTAVRMAKLIRTVC